MKIIHFADLHLGVESYSRLDPATGLPTRFLDFLRTFDELVDYAIESKAGLVLFCGDTYKTRDPTPTQQREFARRIVRLSEARIPVFLLVGNHDTPNMSGRATATEIFSTLEVENVHVSSKPEVVRISTPGGVVQVASLPWARRSALLSKEDTKSLTLEQINERLQQILTEKVASLAGELDPTLPAVLAAHVWVMGATTGSEKGMTIGQEHMLLPGNIARPEFDYVALGHIHRRHVLRENSPPVVYAGSLDRLDFGDEDIDKGFYVVEIAPDPVKRKVSYEFHPVQAKKFLTIAIELKAEDADPTAAALRTINEQKDKVKDAHRAGAHHRTSAD
jgi:exonuclease SbcD